MPFGLVRPQLSLQARRHHGLQGASAFQVGGALVPRSVALQAQVGCGIGQPRAGAGAQQQPVLAGFGQRVQLGQALAQLVGQQQVAALAQRDVAAALCVAQQHQQLLQREHALLVHAQLALQREPVAPAGECGAEGARLGGQHAHRPALGPFQRAHGPALGGQPSQVVHGGQRLLGIVQRPGGIGRRFTAGVGQEGQQVEHRGQVLALGGQRALGGQADASAQRHQPHTPVAGRKLRTKVAEGPHGQRQAQRVATRLQLRHQPRVAGHRLARGGVAVQHEVAGQHAQGGIQLGAGVGRHGPALRHQFGHAPLCRRDAQQPRTIRRIAHHAQAVAALDLGIDLVIVGQVVLERRVGGDLQGVVQSKDETFFALGAGCAFAPHFQHRQAFDEFHGHVGGVVEGQRRVALQRHCSLHQVQAQLVGAIAALAQATRHGGVARVEPVALFQLQQRQQLGLAARSGSGLEGPQVRHPAVAVQRQQPAQRFQRFVDACAAPVAQRDDGGQRLAPGVLALGEVGHRPRWWCAVRPCWHRAAQLHAGLQHQIGLPRQASVAQRPEQRLRLRQRPGGTALAQPGRQHQAVGQAVRRA